MKLKYQGHDGIVTLTVPLPEIEGVAQEADWVMTAAEAVVIAQSMLVAAYAARGNTPTEATIAKAKGMVLR